MRRMDVTSKCGGGRVRQSSPRSRQGSWAPYSSLQLCSHEAVHEISGIVWAGGAVRDVAGRFEIPQQWVARHRLRYTAPSQQAGNN
jgi:hypothetical protein